MALGSAGSFRLAPPPRKIVDGQCPPLLFGLPGQLLELLLWCAPDADETEGCAPPHEIMSCGPSPCSASSASSGACTPQRSMREGSLTSHRQINSFCGTLQLRSAGCCLWPRDGLRVAGHQLSPVASSDSGIDRLVKVIGHPPLTQGPKVLGKMARHRIHAEMAAGTRLGPRRGPPAFPADWRPLPPLTHRSLRYRGALPGCG